MCLQKVYYRNDKNVVPNEDTISVGYKLCTYQYDGDSIFYTPLFMKGNSYKLNEWYNLPNRPLEDGKYLVGFHIFPTELDAYKFINYYYYQSALLTFDIMCWMLAEVNYRGLVAVGEDAGCAVTMVTSSICYKKGLWFVLDKMKEIQKCTP
jgi:hypothetical protein